MKIMFDEILTLMKINEIILDTEHYIYGTAEGYKHACDDYGESLLPKRAHLLSEILDEFKDDIYEVRHLHSMYPLHMMDIKFLEKVTKFSEDYAHPLHRKFILEYITGTFSNYPKIVESN